ncbi:hypothetical protein UFOVP12_24 [uncultured Caudovirales phage]|uniref:Uncharacterized protein n=1 Tax=uncultured Caudovirales phage TaxID=2100421 RepID=A0A6J5KMC5_9CAUD|nr:hypothetical protein UFOVP12_24 [uncultured Caudovirales phage]
MQSEKINLIDLSEVTITRQTGINEGLQATGVYAVECLDASGQIKWSEEFKNLVVTAGKNDILDKYFAGSAYTAAWYLGLVDGASSPTYAAGDTLASHSGWTENTGYSGTRKAPAWGSASAGSKVTTATSFSINASGTVAGAFMCTATSGTSGVLYSAGSFTGGNRTVASGDTLNVTYTASV